MSATYNSQNLALMKLAAARFAAAERSDPFAYSRAMRHIQNGIATYAKEDGSKGYYDAEESTETRYLPDGRDYQATVFKNVQRP